MSPAPSFLQQRLPLGDLLDLRAFSEVCQSFAELYRVGLKVFDEAGNKLVDVKVGNADFCGYIWTKAAGREQCVATVGRVKADAGRRGGQAGRLPVLLRLPLRGPAGALRGRRHGPGGLRPLRARGPGRSCRPRSPASPPTSTRPRPRGYLQKIRRVPQETAEKILKHFMDLVDVMVFTGHKNLIAARLHIEAVQESYRELQDKNRQLEESFAEAQGARPAQVQLPRHHEPRAAHAAHQRHRLLGDDAGGAGRAAHRRAARVPRHHHGEGREPAPAHHLDPRHLQDRGRPGPAGARRGGRGAAAHATRWPPCCRPARKKGLKVVCEPGAAAAPPRRPREAAPVPRQPRLQRREVHRRPAGP